VTCVVEGGTLNSWRLNRLAVLSLRGKHYAAYARLVYLALTGTA